MNIEKIYFETEDKINLFGLLHTPDTKTDEIIISVHGMGSNCMKKREDIFAQNITKSGKAYFSFNNRGAELMTRLSQDDKILIAGTAFEEILDSHFDINAAINKMRELGYKKVHLLGHSLGCTKLVYWYNKVNLNNEYNISSVNLLSLVDIPDCQKYFFKHNFDSYVEYAIQKEKEGKQEELMPEESVDEPLCVRTYLRYFKYNQEIDFAKFWDTQYEFKELNNIKVPLFIRWGTVNEIIVQKPQEVVEIVTKKVKNDKLNIGYIEGANHSFYQKEEIVINQILEAIN